MQFDNEKLKKIIEKHRKYYLNEEGGERADLSGANLFGADLSRANLSGADLSGANLSRANLFGANLFGADLFGANLSGADLSRANLSDANLSRAILSGANLSRANLFGANLSGADLSRANLFGANLSGADLFGANLFGANLFGADLSGANLFGANLSSAKLNEETNITGESWKEYLEKVVPALLTAGGKTIQEIVESGCWNCHEWQNCPMHIAFGINNKEDGPILLRPRIKQFIQLFDFNLIPCPVVPFTSVN